MEEKPPTIVKTKTGAEFLYYGQMEEKHGDILEHLAYIKEKGYKIHNIEIIYGFLQRKKKESKK